MGETMGFDNRKITGTGTTGLGKVNVKHIKESASQSLKFFYVIKKKSGKMEKGNRYDSYK